MNYHLTETENLLTERGDLKLYSKKAIGIATFIGGPLAAGYMIRQNYINLNNFRDGNRALTIGIVTTILLFGSLFLLPESIMDKVPNYVLPAIYTGIIFLIVERVQGFALNQHKEEGKEFYSGWQTAGVGFASLAILVIGVVGVTMLSSTEPELEKYDVEMARFSKNESETMAFYDHIETQSRESLLMELEKKVIPKWKENIGIIKTISQIEDLPAELLVKNKLILEYAQLRMEAFELFHKGIRENSFQYNSQIEELHKQIDVKIAQLE